MKRHIDSYLSVAATKTWWHTDKKNKKKRSPISAVKAHAIVAFSDLIFSVERIPTFPQTHATIYKKTWSCTGSRSASQPCITTEKEAGPNSTYCKPHSSDWKKRKRGASQWPTSATTLKYIEKKGEKRCKNNITSVTLLNEKPHHAFFIYQNLASITYRATQGSRSRPWIQYRDMFSPFKSYEAANAVCDTLIHTHIHIKLC